MSMSLSARVRCALSALLILVALPQAALATLDDVGHAPPSKHRIRFVLHPDVVAGLTPTETGRRLGQYVADMNTVFLRETVRSFVFDPATDVRLLTGAETCASVSRWVAYEIQICAEKSALGYSYGGNAGASFNPPAGVITGMKWHTVYDPVSLSTQIEPPAQKSPFEDYLRRQLPTLLHEAEHVFGAGSGEYYSLALITDRSGVAPIVDLRLQNVGDRFWYEHAHWSLDPLLRGGPAHRQREDYLTNVRFAAGTKATINTDWSGYTAMGNYMAGVSSTVVRVTDPVTRTPLPGATVMVWRTPSPSDMAPTLVGQGTTDANGRFVFDWGCGTNCFNNFTAALIAKAWVPGRQPAVKWFSIFDAFEQRAVQRSSEVVIDLPANLPDATPPSVTLIAPGTVTVGQPVTVQVRNPLDSGGVFGVQVIEPEGDTACTTKVDANCLWIPKRGNVTTSVRAVVTDLAGNSTVATARVTVLNPSDMQPPTIAVTAPGTAKLGVRTLLSPQVSDNVAVTHIQLWENGVYRGVVNRTPFIVGWTPTARGYSHIELRAGDAAGNRASASFGVVVQ